MVWEDIDGNGVRDPFGGEMGLAGWTVQLYDANGLLLSSAPSDDAGNYIFAALPAGTYSVCVLADHALYHQTDPLSGTGCGGLGYSFPILGNLGSWTVNINFGEMLNP